jgi:hypothetical protein
MELVILHGFQYIIFITIAVVVDLLFVATLLRFCSFKFYTSPQYVDAITPTRIHQRAHTKGNGGDPKKD